MSHKLPLTVAIILSSLTYADAQPTTQPAYPRPILDGYTADPHAVVFGDTYYVYPTSDKNQWLTTDFSVWSSKDLINWKKEGMVLDVANDLGWAKIRAWAPAAIGTGHHSVINVPGTDRWYVVYHRHAIPNGNGYTRETCIARMEFNEDGTIREVDPMAEVFPAGSAGDPIQRN